MGILWSQNLARPGTQGSLRSPANERSRSIEVAEARQRFRRIYRHGNVDDPLWDPLVLCPAWIVSPSGFVVVSFPFSFLVSSFSAEVLRGTYARGKLCAIYLLDLIASWAFRPSEPVVVSPYLFLAIPVLGHYQGTLFVRINQSCFCIVIGPVFLSVRDTHMPFGFSYSMICSQCLSRKKNSTPFQQLNGCALLSP
jgi:hypothetical protein